MKSFEEIYNQCNLQEKVFNLRQIPTSAPVQRLIARGIDDVVLGDKVVPDVHGQAAAQAKGYRGYGRGGFDNRTDRVWADQGQSAGHPSNINGNFYWGATVDQRTGKGELQIKGARVGADEKIQSRAGEVIGTITPMVPRVK